MARFEHTNTYMKEEPFAQFQSQFLTALSAYEEARQQPLSAGERACLPWCQVWLNVFFFLSKAQRMSEDIEKAVADDLRPAEALASTL